jgi:hypothetical protein
LATAEAAMAQQGQRKCLCCGKFFFPDHRNAKRQRYCSAQPCRRASKSASQAAWLAKAGNADYFRGPVHVQRVRDWRTKHPGYARGHRRSAAALQDRCPRQVPDAVDESGDRGVPPKSSSGLALQDCLPRSELVLTGLVAHLFELTLQEDMAPVLRRLVQLGQGLTGVGGASDETAQARAASRPAAPRAGPVQLG